MKHILFILFIAIPLVACNSTSKDQTNTTTIDTKKEEATQDNLEQKIIPYEEKYPSGGIKIKGQKIDGEKAGKWISYYEDGKLWSEINYYHGEKSGKAYNYYNNGMLRYKGAYVNDLKQGPWHFYNEEGKIVKNVTYHKGEINEKK